MSDYYSYIFVRQDLTPEQQLIQFGHVCCVVGSHLPHNISPHRLNFVGIGVPNEHALIKALTLMSENNIEWCDFIEPDMDYQMTAAASLPVRGETRNVFSKYNTLKFNLPNFGA